MNGFDLKVEPNYINAEGTAYEIIRSYGFKSPEEIDLEAIAMDR